MEEETGGVMKVLCVGRGGLRRERVVCRESYPLSLTSCSPSLEVHCRYGEERGGEEGAGEQHKDGMLVIGGGLV